MHIHQGDKMKLKADKFKVCTDCDCLCQFRLIAGVLHPFCPECESASHLVSVAEWETLNGTKFDW